MTIKQLRENNGEYIILADTFVKSIRSEWSNEEQKPFIEELALKFWHHNLNGQIKQVHLCKNLTIEFLHKFNEIIEVLENKDQKHLTDHTSIYNDFT